jgi:hypothetical protein
VFLRRGAKTLGLRVMKKVAMEEEKNQCEQE